MTWSLADEVVLPAVPIVSIEGYSIEQNDVEFIGDSYNLKEGQKISVEFSNHDLEVKNISPNKGKIYSINKIGIVEFDGLALTGDKYGSLTIGIYHPSLAYPLKVLRFQLGAPLQIKGNLEWSPYSDD